MKPTTIGDVIKRRVRWLIGIGILGWVIMAASMGPRRRNLFQNPPPAKAIFGICLMVGAALAILGVKSQVLQEDWTAARAEPRVLADPHGRALFLLRSESG